MSFAEWCAASHFSFLRGASHPSDMVARAAELGLAGLGLADRCTVAGVVRAHVALRDARAGAKAETGHDIAFHFSPGARLVFADGTPDIVAHPANRAGWGRLTRLLTLGNRRAEKGGCELRLPDLLAHADDLLLIAMSPDAGLLRVLADAAPGRAWQAATMPRAGADRRRLATTAALADRHGVPLLATNAPLYARPEDRPVADVLLCIREGLTVQSAGRRLAANAEAHIKAPLEMARLFADRPDAVRETLAFAERARFSLDELRYEYPEEPVPEGWTPQAWLEELTWRNARARHPGGVPEKLRKLLESEFALIAQLDYARYFLTVHDIVAFARGRGILCQGRGSAANSAVCFLLGITSVDPVEHNLLFSRFISAERNEPPDIDVDFEHERREEVIQYIYERYGRERAGIAATVIHYRQRSTVREAGKALGLSEDVTARLTSTVWGSYAGKLAPERFEETGFSLDNPEIARLRAICDRLLQAPRHLSQHVGGFVLTNGRLDEMVPIHNGAMPDRTFIEWDKDDIDALGLMKVDILALGMLTCIAKAFDLMRGAGLGDYALETIQWEDPDVYAMLTRGDSVGVFQVESRAQMNMLPRLRPKEFYDLVVQVAIVRPGPIEGEMVHPYLRRRQGIERWSLPCPAPPHDPHELKELLGKTYGVPLFQEQAMKLAIVAAAFSPEDANRLRRAMATFRNVGTMHNFQAKLVDGMVARGYQREFAERCYKQIEGFGSYGFPESHAQSFARLVYVSAWIKHHHPAAFAAALLNSQPMGFYAPAQIVRDAEEHGVTVLPPDVNISFWNNALEPWRDAHALRLGFRQIDGFREAWADALVAARADGPFDSIEALARRAALPRRALRLLADADACGALGGRREALWEARRTPGDALPLFAHVGAAELGDEPDAALPTMALPESVVADYQALRLSLRAHPVAFLRERLAADGVVPCAKVQGGRDGAKVAAAGIVLVRQRPGKGNAIFMTLEDETGIANVVLWASDFERQRLAVMAARLMEVRGRIQRSPEGVVHLMATTVIDRSAELDLLSQTHRAEPQLSRADTLKHPQHPGNGSRAGRVGHPRDARLLPHSRDFH